MRYTSRGIRRRGEGNQWEVILSHKDPLTGEVVPTYHTITAKTKKQRKAATSLMSKWKSRRRGKQQCNVQQFMTRFLAYKEASGTIEPSTIQANRAESRGLLRAWLERLCDLTIPAVNSWMAEMIEAVTRRKA